MRQVLAQGAENGGDRPFIIHGDERISHHEHYARVEALASALVQEFGVRQGDRIVIAVRNYPEWSVSFFASVLVGAVAVPLNALWTGPELAFGITDSHSGDIARFDDEGYLYIVDRAKDIIIRGGENVSSAEVEAALFEHRDVADAAAIGVPHQVLGEEVGAVVHMRPGAALDDEALREHLESRLAAFKIPSHFWFVDEPLPRNPAGKVLKRDLRDRFAGDEAAGKDNRTGA